MPLSTILKERHDFPYQNFLWQRIAMHSLVYHMLSLVNPMIKAKPSFVWEKEENCKLKEQSSKKLTDLTDWRERNANGREKFCILTLSSSQILKSVQVYIVTAGYHKFLSCCYQNYLYCFSIVYEECSQPVMSGLRLLSLHTWATISLFNPQFPFIYSIILIIFISIAINIHNHPRPSAENVNCFLPSVYLAFPSIKKQSIVLCRMKAQKTLVPHIEHVPSMFRRFLLIQTPPTTGFWENFDAQLHAELLNISLAVSLSYLKVTPGSHSIKKYPIFCPSYSRLEAFFNPLKVIKAMYLDYWDGYIPNLVK